MSIEIENLYEILPPKYKVKPRPYANEKKLQISVPNRFLFVAPSGAGKTNLLLNIIRLIGNFTKIYIFAKCFDSEPLWEWFIEQIREAEAALSEKKGKPVQILMVASSNLNDLPSVDDFSKAEHNLVVFDDFITEKNKNKLANMSDLWVRGRKQTITSMYLSQNYFEIPITVRKNNGILILKDLGTERDKSAILKEVAQDRTMDEMKAMFNACETEQMKNFFLIDTSANRKDKALRYRHNFTPFVFK